MRLRIGMIGTGWVTEKHLESFARVAEGEPVAIAGRNGERAAALAKQHGLTAYADPRDMVAAERLDAVWISLAPHAHGELEHYLAGKVAGVMVEKPVSRSLDTARRIRDAFARHRTVAAAGYMNRYRPGVMRARTWFAHGPDKPVLAVGRWIGDMPGPMWWRRQRESGGQYVEQLTHVIDLARWLVGEVESVTAQSAGGFVTDAPEYDIADATVSTLAFRSGAVGAMTTGCFTRHAAGVADGVGLTVAAREKAVSFAGWNMDATFSGPSAPEPDAGEAIERAGGIFAAQNGAFLRAVLEGRPEAPHSTYADAVETLRVTLAAVRAAEQGRTVRIADL